MPDNLQTLRPKNIWKNFEELCKIPRPSKKEQQVASFIKNFAENLNLDYKEDETGNIVVKKPATPGMENKKKVILQGHLDMVPQKNMDKKHDFEKDPIEPIIDGEWVKANGTTLGADNGIGVAAAMAVLESKDLPHPSVEALFTMDEETGMTGAFGLKPGFLDGDILLNMDSEEDGELIIGCAGGMNSSAEFALPNVKTRDGSVYFHIAVQGLKGGHSGTEINIGRGNANKILIRLIWETYRLFDIQVSKIEGGGMRNAIPREAFAWIAIPENKAKPFRSYFQQFTQKVKSELQSSEPDLYLTLKETEAFSNVFEPSVQQKIINAVYACPHGVIRSTPGMSEVPETSTNLASLQTNENNFKVFSLMRSSVDTAKEDLGNQMKALFELAGAKVENSGAYPGWQPKPDSTILKVMQDIYVKKFKEQPKVEAIHAGLECGIIGSVYPNLDMLSFGPTIQFPHSPDERVNIKAVEKFWDYLTDALKNIPEK